VQPFEGGFATWGAIAEGVDLQIAEGWSGARSAVHQIAFIALPDEHTVVGLQLCRTDAHRTYAVEVKGLHLNLPNDLFNGFSRQLWTAEGERMLHAPSDAERIVSLESPWVSIEGRVGVVRLYGDESLVVHRVPGRRGGKFASLYVDQVCLGCVTDLSSHDPGETIIDCGWAVLSALDADETRSCALESVSVDLGLADVRGVRVRGADRWYAIVVNWGKDTLSLPARALGSDGKPSTDPLGYDLIRRRRVSWRDELTLLRGQVGVLALGRRKG
jgi:hypothetical protein